MERPSWKGRGSPQASSSKSAPLNMSIDVFGSRLRRSWTISAPAVLICEKFSLRMRRPQPIPNALDNAMQQPPWFKARPARSKAFVNSAANINIDAVQHVISKVTY